MKLTYEDTKEYLTNQLLESVSKGNDENKELRNSLSQSEILFNVITKICKNLYNNQFIPINSLEEFSNYGIQLLNNGWFYIENKSLKGKFINVNAVFKNAYCESKECHKSAYLFMMDYNLEELKLRSGTINPYNYKEEILHSICTFKKGGNEYVFDGAYYLLMDKDFYYNLFKFNETQSLSRDTILIDRKTLSKKRITSNSKLKSNIRYRLAKSHIYLSRRFSGIGFVVYLYNREAFLDKSKKTPLSEFEKQNDLALEKLNNMIEEKEGEEARKF